jgi:hypothetical protein
VIKLLLLTSQVEVIKTCRLLLRLRGLSSKSELMY